MLVWYFVVWDVGESLEFVQELEIHRSQSKSASSHVITRLVTYANPDWLARLHLLWHHLQKEIMLNERVCVILTTRTYK